MIRPTPQPTEWRQGCFRISSAWHLRRHCRLKTPLAASCSDGVQCMQVQGQLRKGNADMAMATIEKEKLLQELRNQIAIIR